MKVLVLGSGGREDSIARKLEEELGEESVIIAPGNGSIPESRRKIISLAARNPPFSNGE